MLTCAAAIVFAAESGGRNIARWVGGRTLCCAGPLYYAAGAAILFFGVFGQSAFIYQQF